MPNLVRLYIESVAIGFALAFAFVVALMALDVAGLRDLILGSDIGWVAAVMLVVFNGIVFAGAQFAFAVMRLAEDGEGPRGGRMERAPALVRVSVTEERDPRQRMMRRRR